jgi:G3E family GTPase
MTFLEARYSDLLRLDSITCVVDAEALLQSGDSEALAMLKLRQIGFADMVILNKVDLVGSASTELVRRWIDSHLNRVRIIEAQYCDVPYEVLLSVGRFDPARAEELTADLGTPHPAPGFDTWHFLSDDPLNESALRTAVRELPAAVYRCKGFVQLADKPNERTVLQTAGRRTELTSLGPWGELTPRTDLVVIGAEGSIDADHLQAAFDACVETI